MTRGQWLLYWTALIENISTIAKKLCETMLPESNGQTNSETLEFLCAGHCSKLLECINSLNRHCGSMSNIGLVIVLIPQMRQLRHREIKSSLIPLSPTVSKATHLSAMSLTPMPVFIITHTILLQSLNRQLLYPPNWFPCSTILLYHQQDQIIIL